jgi:hypothetical protein
MPMRKQVVSMTDRQTRWLDAEVKRLDVPPAEIIRRVLDEHIDRIEADLREERK